MSQRIRVRTIAALVVVIGTFAVIIAVALAPIDVRLPRMPMDRAPVPLLSTLGIGAYSWILASLYLVALALLYPRLSGKAVFSLRTTFIVAITAVVASGAALVFWALMAQQILSTGIVIVSRFVLRYLFTSGLPFWIAAGLVFVFVEFLSRKNADQGEKESTQTEYPAHFPVNRNGRVDLIPASAVIRINAAGNYAELHTTESTHLVSQSLGDLEKRLDPRSFIRIHRSHIAHIKHIEHLDSHTHGEFIVTFSTGDQIKSGRRFSGALRALVR